MKDKIGKRILLASSLLLFFVSLGFICYWVDINYIKPDENYSDFENTPSSMQIEQISMTMTSYLWRDFMPGWGERNHSLICAITLTTNISSDFLAEIQINKFWAINSKSTWYISRLNHYVYESDYRIYDNRLEIIIRNGPDNDLWQEGTIVDVVLQFRYKLNFYFLQSIDIPIVYTY